MITPEPTEEEAAAIVAALDAVQPRAVEPGPTRPMRWRWSGRWWSKPIAARRRRPW